MLIADSPFLFVVLTFLIADSINLIAVSSFLFAVPSVYLQFRKIYLQFPPLPHPLFKKRRLNVIGASPLIIQ
ncbi:hypothetical protein [Bacillus sp. AFS053548]|uniref:hypothetical protein n=1 Tax=Bacillus sp. AFS053548 TaxID=2033505 RepID=UPI000BFD4C85|nr:hypothetical protein [Bacillus sp. AFS053548]PGM52255.1 hypothetical protein CN946_19380 [Bacillus sp. AFS053548]